MPKPPTIFNPDFGFGSGFNHRSFNMGDCAWKYHREDGPAVESDNRKQYFINNVGLTYDEWRRLIKMWNSTPKRDSNA